MMCPICMVVYQGIKAGTKVEEHFIKIQKLPKSAQKLKMGLKNTK